MPNRLLAIGLLAAAAGCSTKEAAAVESKADSALETTAAATGEDGEEKPGEKVVSLDAFRKKP